MQFDNLLEILPEEMSSIARSISLLHSLEKNHGSAFLFLFIFWHSSWEERFQVATIEQQPARIPKILLLCCWKGLVLQNLCQFLLNKLTWSTIHYQIWFIWWPSFTKKHWSFGVWVLQGSHKPHSCSQTHKRLENATWS